MPEPEITVATNGDLLLNTSAFAVLGEPRGVGLFYNEDRHLIGIRPGGKMPVTRLSESQWRIKTLGFWRCYGIIVTATSTYTATLWTQVAATGAALDGDVLVIDVADLVDESNAFRELMETPANQTKERGLNMDIEHWVATYGPPATDAPYRIGQTLIYHEGQHVENGEILYIAAEPFCYVVSPAGDVFPTPVYPSQVIAAM